MCTVFAESEVISFRVQGIPKEDIATGLVESIARCVAAMARPMGLKDHVALVGGVAKNEGIRAALEREHGHAVYVPPEPQITAAVGAAIITKADPVILTKNVISVCEMQTESLFLNR